MYTLNPKYLHKLRESKSIRLCPVLTFVASYFDNNGCVELFSEDSKYVLL